MSSLLPSPLRARADWPAFATWEEELTWVIVKAGDARVYRLTVESFPEVAALVGATDDAHLHYLLSRGAKELSPRGLTPSEARKERAARCGACARFYVGDFGLTRDKYDAYVARAQAPGNRAQPIAGYDDVRTQDAWAWNVEKHVLRADSTGRTLPGLDAHPNVAKTGSNHRKSYSRALIGLIKQLADDDYGDDEQDIAAEPSPAAEDIAIESAEVSGEEPADESIAADDTTAQQAWRSRIAAAWSRLGGERLAAALSPSRRLLFGALAVALVGVLVAGVSTQWFGLATTTEAEAESPGGITSPDGDAAEHEITSSSWGPPRDAVSALSRNSVVTLNSMIDHPDYGDERNFVRVRHESDGNDAYTDQLTVAPGETYVAHVRINNDASPDATDAVATNTRVRLQMPAVVYGSANVHALVSADNATPGTVWDGFTLVLSDPDAQAALRFVPDSAQLSIGGQADGAEISLEELVSEEGALIGCDALHGNLPSSDDCAGFLTFRFVVDQPNFTVDAAARLKGSGEPFANHIDVSPGDVVEVRLLYTNTGTTQQDDVSLRVLGLPENIRYVPESSQIANAKTGGSYKPTLDGVTTVGYNLGSYTAGSNAYFKFDAIVEEDSSASAAGSRWLVGSPFVRLTTGNGYKEADLTFTLFSNAKPTAQQTGDDASDYWEASWGPQREMFTISSGGAPYPVFNSISDNDVFGDERNFVSLRQETEADVPNVWQDDVWARVGETYIMRVYVNNAGADSNGTVSAGWLHDVKLKAGLSHGDNETSVYGILSAANTTTVWDGATLHYDDGATVVFDAEYTLLENNAHPDGGLQLGGAALSDDGVQLGYEEMDGIIRPGYQYAGYVTFRLHVVES